MNNAILNDMTSYFLKTQFDGIPSVPARFVPDNDIDGALGGFFMGPATDYEESKDELFNSPGYRTRWNLLFDNMGYSEIEEESWKDPINHPRIEIQISNTLRHDALLTTAALLHELTHYWCWYMGYDYSDESYAFNAECMKRGIPANYYGNSLTEGCWEGIFDFSRMAVHIEAYIAYRNHSGSTVKHAGNGN